MELVVGDKATVRERRPRKFPCPNGVALTQDCCVSLKVELRVAVHQLL
jgi:hypothetical protein